MPMPTHRNTNLSPLYAMLALSVILCLSVLSKCGVLPTVNDAVKKSALQDLESDFNTVRHPEQTERVDLQKGIGRLTGDSRNCDIFVGEVRSYGGDRDAITTTYASQTLQGRGEIRVIFIEANDIPAADRPDLPTAFNSLSQWDISPASLEQSLYLIYVFIRDYNPGTKIDCQ
mgnify:CR=1 FL=1